MFGSVDFVVVGVYAALMAGLAWVAKQRTQTVDDYFAAGHRLPWWMAAISHHVSGYSAVVFVGFAGKAATAGVSVWMIFSVPCFIALMIGSLAWAPRWSRLRVLTPVEYLETRYGNSVRLLIALAGIGVKFIDLGIKLYAIAIVVQLCTGWGIMTIIAATGLVTIAYVLVGGLWATVLTDLVQFVVQFVLSIAVVGLVLSAVGGWTSMWDQLPPEHSSLLNPGAGISLDYWFVILVVTILSYNGATWGLAQRFIAVGEARDTRKAAVLSAFLYLLYPLAIFIPAWAAPLIAPEFFQAGTLLPVDGFDPDQTYVLVAQRLLADAAPGLIGLLVCSMFAATMSMIDSDINSLAAVFTKDIYERNFRRNASSRTLSRVGRLATLVFGLAILAVALSVAGSAGVGKVFSQTVHLFGAILPPVAIPLMFGMLWKRTTARGAILSLVGGFATLAVLMPLYPDGYPIYAGGAMTVSFVIYFGEGLLRRGASPKDKEVDALFRKLAGSASDDSDTPPTEQPAG